MKKIKFTLMSLLMISVLLSCSKTEMEEIVELDSHTLKSTLNVVPLDVCNDEPVVFDLMAGQHTNAGTVTLVNDEYNLYVTFETTDECLKEVHVYVGDPENVPTTDKAVVMKSTYKKSFKKGHFKKSGKKSHHFTKSFKVQKQFNSNNTPVPGQFPYKAEHIYKSSYTIVIPLDEIDAECPIVLAHAALCNGETAWGWEDQNEDFTFENYFGTSRWGYLGDYCIEYCDEEPENLFMIKFFYKWDVNSSGWAVIEATDPNYYDGDEWCSLAGVVGLSGDDTFNMMSWGHTYFGPMNVTLTDGVISGEIEMDTDIYTITKICVFYGTAEELDALGDCPDYFSFPYIFEGGEGVHTFEINLD